MPEGRGPVTSSLGAQVTSGTDSSMRKDLLFPLPRPTSKLHPTHLTAEGLVPKDQIRNPQAVVAPNRPRKDLPEDKDSLTMNPSLSLHQPLFL